MFETYGAISKPIPTLWPLALALWPLVVAVLCVARHPHTRMRSIAVLAAGAVAHLLTMGALLIRMPEASRLLLTHLAVGARSGMLDLTLALALDPLSALASAGACAVGALLVARQGRSAFRRIALLGALTSAVEVVLLADSAPMLVLGGATASLLGGLLGRASAASFVADRIADAAVILAAGILFWALGGSWIHGEYVPELDPRVVVAKSERAATPNAVMEEDEDDRGPPSRGGRAWLSFPGLPGSAMMVDGAWIRARAPFIDAPISPGSHTLRVHVGGGSDDYFIPRIVVAEGEHVWAVTRGPTVSSREARDDLAVDTARAALARRQVMPFVLVLAWLAFAARVRSFPFMPAAFEPARALGAMGCVGVARFFALGEVSPVALAIALGATLVTALTGGVLAAELGFVFVGFIAGAPWIATLHAIGAALVWRWRWARWALLPTKAVIIGALYAVPHGVLPTALAVIAAMALLFPRRTSDAGASAFARAMGRGVQAVAATTLGIEHSIVAFVDQLHRAWRAAGMVLADLEDLVASLPMRTWAPSERAAQLIVVPLAVLALVLFAIPWAG